MVNNFLQYIFKVNLISNKMSSNQVEINFMILKLKQMDKQLGGNSAKKVGDSQFDYLQQEFLSKRHKVQKFQDLLEKDGGFNATNANSGYEIREGIAQMKQLLQKLKQQHRRLVKKKKDTPEILQRKKKIVQNCQLLLKDIQDRQTDGVTKNKTKVITLTDLKAKLLHQIDQNNDFIHDKNSDGDKLTENLAQDRQQINKWNKKDQQMDVMVDDIIAGVKGIKGKVKKINEAQDVIIQKTKKADQKVGKLQKRIKGDNQKLKKIIEQFKPNRCCTYLVLFLLLVGLIVCVIKLLI